jgi:hypothetical protein
MMSMTVGPMVDRELELEARRSEMPVMSISI